MPEPDVQTFVNQSSRPFAYVPNRGWFYHQDPGGWFWDQRSRALKFEISKIFEIPNYLADRFIPQLAASTLRCEDLGLKARILKSAGLA